MRIPTFTQFQQQAQMIAKQFDKLGQLQSQAATGRRIINPSDDPILAGQINSINDYINQVNSYGPNANLVSGRASLFEQSSKGMLESIRGVQKVINQVKSDTNLTDVNRASYAKELRSYLQTLMNTANTQDAEGKYIYGGYNTSAPPYLQSGGVFQYQGGLSDTYVDIGINANAVYNASGYHVFSNINNGNGTFSVTANGANPGKAYITPGTVTSADYVADTYTITFVTNGAGKLAYQVFGATGGQVAPPPPATVPADAIEYVPGTNGMDISFKGVHLTISDGAKVGDVFQVQPSSKQDVFTTVQNLINLMENPITNRGQFDQALSQLSAGMEQVSTHFVTYQSDIGSQRANISNQIAANGKLVANQIAMRKDLQDADITDVISQLSQQSLALQVTQQSYLKIQEVLTQLLKS